MIDQHTQDFGSRIEENELLENLKKLVQAAFTEGFIEGMREHSTSRGGKPWRESKACRRLQEMAALSPHERQP